MDNNQDTLNWKRIENDDNIKQLIDKLNYNFSQFSMHNGGSPGRDGLDGANGGIVLSRSSIHCMNQSDMAEDENFDAIDDLYSKYCREEILEEGDLLIYGRSGENGSSIVEIYRYEYDSNSESELVWNKKTTIEGIKGLDAEENINAIRNFIEVPASGDNRKLMYSSNNVTGFILDNSNNFENSILNAENHNEYSFLFTKKNDGLVFYKEFNGTYGEDTIISHTTDVRTNKTSFSIIDNSDKGSVYFSKNKLVLAACEKSLNNVYEHSITLDDSGIKINDENNIELNADSIDIISKEINITSDVINFHNDVTINGVLTVVDEIDSKKLISGEVHANNLYVTDTAKFKKIEIEYDGNYRDINDVYARKDGAFDQFITNTVDKATLRRQIGALGENDLAGYNFDLTPIGTIIMHYGIGCEINPNDKIKPINSSYEIPICIIEEGNYNYIMCNGAEVLLEKDTYEDLYNLYANQENDLYKYFSKYPVVVDENNGYFKLRLPDFGSRFPVGYNPLYNDYNKIGSTGGQKEVTLTIDQMPNHSHWYQKNTKKEMYLKDAGSDNGKGIWAQTGAVGGDQPHENRPPYITVAFFMKIGNIGTVNNQQQQP